MADEHKRGAATATGADHHQYLTFILGGETFALGIMRIKEIIEYGHLTEVPMVPGYIRGVINLRGSVVPVIDLAVRFGRAPSELARRTCVVIIEAGTAEARQDLGVIVDAVNEVMEIPTDQIEPPPSFGARIRTEFIAGMGKVGDRFVIILDVDHVLSLEDLAQLERVGSEEAVS